MRLVLCDGQRLLLDALATALLDLGHDVTDVSEPDELPDLVARLQPQLCVLEAMYQGEMRLDAAAAVRRSRPETVMVLLTGDAPVAVWDVFDQSGVDGVVSKSSSFARVDSAIRAAVQGRRQVTGFRRPTAGDRVVEHDLEALTAREMEVLRLLVDGVPTHSIATRLGVSRNTVRTHVASVFRKLQVHDRGKAVSHAVDLGILEPAGGAH